MDSFIFRASRKRKFFTVAAVTIAAVLMVLTGTKNVLAASFNPSNLASNADFIGVDSMSTGDIQSFLNGRGSCLKDYSQDGRSAASIIHDAAHGHGDASGSFGGITINSSTGTVNPGTLLVTLQKEQSLITDPSRCVDDVLRKSMGYGCPDSGGCNSKYAGFTKQVEWGAWQLRYNYERAAGHGFSNYQVGEDFCFDDYNGTHCGKFDNRATASLYRYTPHVYNGNYNYWNLFYNVYRFQVPAYAHTVAYQSGYPALARGQASKFILRVKNTGTQTWRRGKVNLATSHGRDRISPFLREGGNPSGWISSNRIAFKESSVAPNRTATYEFYMQVPRNMAGGSYNEYFQLVADGAGWMRDYGIYWRITVPPPTPSYAYSFVSQNRYPVLSRRGSYKFVVRIKNTGTKTWRKNKVNLGTSHGTDRVSAFIRGGGNPSGWISSNRIAFKESSVARNGIATYEFYMKVPSNMPSGVYNEYFQPVAEGIGWMRDVGIYWRVRVR